MKTTIAVLGTGRMGTALASAFLSQQHLTHVFNRTRAHSEPLRAKGATIASSVAEAVASAQAVFVRGERHDGACQTASFRCR